MPPPLFSSFAATMMGKSVVGLKNHPSNVVPPRAAAVVVVVAVLSSLSAAAAEVALP